MKLILRSSSIKFEKSVETTCLFGLFTDDPTGSKFVSEISMAYMPSGLYTSDLSGKTVYGLKVRISDYDESISVRKFNVTSPQTTSLVKTFSCPKSGSDKVVMDLMFDTPITLAENEAFIIDAESNKISALTGQDAKYKGWYLVGKEGATCADGFMIAMDYIVSQ